MIFEFRFTRNTSINEYIIYFNSMSIKVYQYNFTSIYVTHVRNDKFLE